MKKIISTLAIVFTILLILSVISNFTIDDLNSFEAGFSSTKIELDLTETDSNISHESNVVSEDEEEEFILTYSALGDSITYGAVPNGGGVQMENPYPVLVGELIGATTVNNYGVNGSTVASGVNSLKPMCLRYSNIDVNSDIISVMGGINDIGKGIPLGSLDDTSTQTFYGALNNLIVGLQEGYKDSFVFFIIPLPNSITYENEMYIPYYDAIRNVCDKHGILYFDAYKECGFENVMFNHGKDTTHPDQDFHQTVLAPMIARFIKENYSN